MSRVYVAGDYAGIKCDNGFELYYGYEVTIKPEGEGEWCFEAEFPNEEEKLTVPFSKIKEYGARDSFECAECLMAGIAYLLDKGILK
jgi:hypothetical protein